MSTLKSETNPMNVSLDGRSIRSERDFHEQAAAALGFGEYYGRNLDALWDFLSDTPRPLTLVWKDSAGTRERLGTRFDAIVRVLRAAEDADRLRPPEKRFRLLLE